MHVVDPALEQAGPLVEDPARREMSRLAALAQIDLHDRTVAAVLQRVVDVTADLLPADEGATIVLEDPSSEVFTDVASSTAAGPTDFPDRGVGSATRWVMDNGAPLVAPDPAGHAPLGDLASDEGEGGYVAMPVLFQGRPIGVLTARAASTREWTAGDVAFVAAVASRAGAAIAAAKSADEARTAGGRADALSHVANALIGVAALPDVLRTVVDGVGAGTAADHVSLEVHDIGSQRGSAVVAGGPGALDFDDPRLAELRARLRDEVVDARLTVVVKGDDVGGSASALVTCAMITPLRYQGRTVGTLTAVRGAGSPEFSNEDASLLTVMASQAVVAIENARLTEETQQALAELSAVYEIVKAQDSEGSSDDVLRNIAEAVASALSAHQAVLGIVDEQRGVIERVVTGGRSRDLVPPSLAMEDVVAGYAGPAIAERRSIAALADGANGPRLAVPLEHRGTLVGVMLVENPPGYPDYTERDLELARMMGSQVAVAIANARLLEETQRLSVTDALTGMDNRRSLFARGEQAFALARRYGHTLSALMIDIDHFKHVNDSYGHAAGDDVLRAVADRFRGGLRDVDILGRYGGEEFAVLLPQTELAGAALVGERLRRSIAATSVETGAGPLPVSISVGVATLVPGTVDIHALLDRADAALLFAKRMGRNRVETG